METEQTWAELDVCVLPQKLFRVEVAAHLTQLGSAAMMNVLRVACCPWSATARENRRFCHVMKTDVSTFVVVDEVRALADAASPANPSAGRICPPQDAFLECGSD